MGGDSDAGDSAFAANGAGAAVLGGDSAMGAPSTDGGSSADGSGAQVLHSQRRSLTPMKRVESRVPVNDVQEQPLLQQARKMLDDQRSKWVPRLLCGMLLGRLLCKRLQQREGEHELKATWCLACKLRTTIWQHCPTFTPCRYRESTQGFGWYDWLGFFLPCFVWLRTYDWRHWLLVRGGRGVCAWAHGWVGTGAVRMPAVMEGH